MKIFYGPVPLDLVTIMLAKPKALRKLTVPSQHVADDHVQAPGWRVQLLGAEHRQGQDFCVRLT